MMIRWIFAALHLVALAIGVSAVWGRAQALRTPGDAGALRRAFRADAIWGLAALLWISTGLVRAFGGLEKGSAYYLGSHAFWTKMALLLAILALEVLPMVTLIRWRIALAKGEPIDTGRAPLIARISTIQGFIVLAMVLVASAMARGVAA